MRRAHETKRFAHPDHLPPSARSFSSNFKSYLDHFDEVMLFDNSLVGDPEFAQPMLIAEKKTSKLELEVYDVEKVQTFFSFGDRL